jgi:hypothetical protein
VVVAVAWWGTVVDGALAVPDEPVPDEPVPDEPVPDELAPDEPVPDLAGLAVERAEPVPAEPVVEDEVLPGIDTDTVVVVVWKPRTPAMPATVAAMTTGDLRMVCSLSSGGCASSVAGRHVICHRLKASW